MKSDRPARELEPAPQWKPGEKVRVMPDLKRSAGSKENTPTKPKAGSASPSAKPVQTPSKTPTPPPPPRTG
jgi:hypothetical protein